MGGGLPLTAANNIINLLARGWSFVLIDREFMPNGPLPKFKGGVPAIAKALWVVQASFLSCDGCAGLGHKGRGRGSLPSLRS